MAGIRLEWAQFGDFDSFDVIRSDTSLASVTDIDLPSPIATNLKTMYYVDTTVTRGNTYYYKVRARRGVESLVSSEIEADALTAIVYLKFNVSTTLDNGTGNTVWSAINNPTIVDNSIYFNGTVNRAYLSSRNESLNFGTDDCYIEFEIKLLQLNMNTYLHVLSGESINGWNNAVQLYIRHNEHLPLVGLEFDYYGSNYACRSGVGTVAYNNWCKIRFERIGTSLKVYINDVLNNTITIPSNLPINFNLNGTRIGSASWSTYSFLNAYLRRLIINKS